MENTENPPGVEITRYLRQWRAGEPGAQDKLAEAIHQELRKLSRAILGPHRADFLLQPTVLMHEFYAKLPAIRQTDWQSRAQFFNTAARIMRNIAVDHARNCQAMKRAGGAITLPADRGARDHAMRIDVLLVNDALDLFAQEYPRQARGVELRFFGGLTAEEIVETLCGDGYGCSIRTVERDWNFAKAWLQNYIEPS
jgi:RNA polymerase sigma factor (TIGR02999 family)